MQKPYIHLISVSDDYHAFFAILLSSITDLELSTEANFKEFAVKFISRARRPPRLQGRGMNRPIQHSSIQH